MRLTQSSDVEGALVRLKLGQGHILQSDRVVHIGGDYNITLPIIVRGGEQSLDIRKCHVIDLQRISCGVKVCDRGVAKTGRKDKRIVIARTRQNLIGGGGCDDGLAVVCVAILGGRPKPDHAIPSAKGNASAPYEFGVKASIDSTNAHAPGGRFALRIKVPPSHPYAGDTLAALIEDTERFTGY
jgi:hypothetical protein